MNKSNNFLMIFALIISQAAPPILAATSFSWSVEPGPHGGYRVHSSAGTYMVVFNGNSVWVGTEEEFDKVRVKSISAQSGFTEFNVTGGSKSDMSFVSSYLPRLKVANYRLADINTDILFAMKPSASAHRQKKPDGTEYVSIVWVQDKTTETSAIIFDRDKQIPYDASYCGRNDEYHNCNFIIPADALTHSATVFFASADGAPGALLLKSIANETYRDIVNKDKGLRPSDEDLGVLAHLHKLDKSIPASIP
jgi:hypothetical protein